MKIVVRISNAHPELQAELARMDTRHRAERLRSLATLGLNCLREGNARARNDLPDQPENEKKQEKISRAEAHKSFPGILSEE